MMTTVQQKKVGHKKVDLDDPWLWRLQEAFPFSYESIRIETGSRPIGFRFSKVITNIVTVLDGREIIATGEANDSETAMAKSFSELIERSALLKFGNKYEAKTSNGWAAHPNRKQVQLNAILELVERDAVLAQWYTKTPFLQIQHQELPSQVLDWAKAELSRSEFPNLKILISTRGLGPAVTCLLTNHQGNGVSAHSTRLNLEDAILNSISEACRVAHASIRKAHWKDTLVLKNLKEGQIDPNAHALYYAYHEPFPAWMFGKIESFEAVKAIWEDKIRNCLEDKQFVYQKVMSAPINVGFALHPQTLTLRWQTTDVKILEQEEGIKRLKLKLETINEKPHIVS